MSYALPIGSVVPSGFDFDSDTLPDNHLRCDGTAVSRTTYSDLYGVIGTTFGVGDGSTTFNLPDLQDKIPLGSGSGGGLTSRTTGATGGSATVAMSSGELPVHNHDANNRKGLHNTGSNTAGSNTGIGVLYSGTSNANGSGGAHDNLPSFIALEFTIIY